jgi:LacI family transcriptional regulator
MKTQTRVRLADVAQRAGVSKSIASRILNGAPGLAVRAETRSRVLDAARELEYEPHAFARRLREARTGAIGLVIPNLEMPVYARIVRGAVRRARALDMAVLLAEDETHAEANDVLTSLVGAGRIDGLIVATAHPGHPLVASLERRNVPHVFVNRAVPGAGCNVTMDDELAGAAAVQHLAGLGHVRVGLVAGPDGNDPSERRIAGFRRAAEGCGLKDAPVQVGPFSERGGAELAGGLLAARPGLTGLVAAGLAQAVGVLHAVSRLGLRVPEDMSVISLDEMPLAGYLFPPLTTVRMPLGELGAASVDALAVQLRGALPQDVVVETVPRVVVRSSTAAPRLPGADAT